MDEIIVHGVRYKRVEPEPHIDIRLDPNPARKRDGMVALIAVIGDTIRELWVRDDASLTEILNDLRAVN